MSYEKAKNGFKHAIEKLQKDAENYASNQNHSEKFLNIKIETINSLIDYYNNAEAYISQCEMDNDEQAFKYIKLREDAEKLVYLCMLYGIDPDLSFQFSKAELESWVNKGLRIMMPVNDVSRKNKEIDMNFTSRFWQAESKLMFNKLLQDRNAKKV